MVRRVLAEVSGGRVRGRPWLGWVDGVKVSFGGVCAIMCKGSERVERPGTYVIE